MSPIEWQILLIAIISEILGTASGLGSSILFLPLAQYFEPPHMVMVLTSVLHVFANGFRVYLFWEPSGFQLLKKWALAFLVASGIGALLSIWTSPPSYKLMLGCLLIVFSVVSLLFSKIRFLLSPRLQLGLTGVAGLLTGWIGTGGAIRAMVLSTLSLSKNEFIFMSSGIDLGGDVLRSVIYIINGYLEPGHIIYIPALALCAWIGSHIGKILVKKIPQLLFERLVLLTILVIGMAQITQYFMEKT